MCPACLRVAGRARAERWKFLRYPLPATRDARPPMTSSPIPAARSQYLLDLLAQVPDSRKRRGRRHALAGLLAVGVAAVIAGSRSFAAVGQWAADAGPEVLAMLGAARGPAEESTFRRAFALVSADVLDPGSRCLAAYQGGAGGGRLVIAIDGKTVRGAKNKEGKAPHLVAALAHGIGAVLGQVAVRGEIERDPRGAGPAEGVRQSRRRGHHDRRHAHAERHRAGHPRPGRRLRDDRGQRPTCRRCTGSSKKLPWAAVPAVSAVSTDHGRRARRTIKTALAAGADRVQGRRPGRAAAPHRHEEGQEDRQGLVYLITSDRDAGPAGPGRLGPRPLGDRKPPSLG